MTAPKEKDITRRKFFKNAAGTALCCECLPLALWAGSAQTPKDNAQEMKNAKITGTGKEHLAAACGTYCGACPAYLARHGEDAQKEMKPAKSASGPAKALKGVPPSNWMDGLVCDGCLSGGVLAAHCRNCAIRLCAAGKQSDSRCTACEELPCYRITNLINMGRYLHREEYLPNLKKFREMGIQEWVKYEEERWSCPRCGRPIRWYDAKCAACGEPRSKRVFPLPAES